MAGTINTTNYNFKKYAPNDTVSMLQTFNGNMDAIDKAIKDRADVETEQGASITKLENGLSSTNNGLNSANQTISAVQVQVTTNTRNIQTTNTEIDSLDARVLALENGGSSILPLQTTLPVQPARYCSKIYKQGNHIFSNSIFVYNAFTDNDFVNVNSADNFSISTPAKCIKLLAINDNIFGLNPNIGHVIGYSTASGWNEAAHNRETSPYELYAIFNGTMTYIVTPANSTWTTTTIAITIETLI